MLPMACSRCCCYRNRIVQVRETFGSLDDFEGILGRLDGYGSKRVKPTGFTSYGQDPFDILHDCAEHMSGSDAGDDDARARGFYPQYLRSDLIKAVREFFITSSARVREKWPMMDSHVRSIGIRSSLP